MSLQTVSPQMQHAGTNRFLSRFIPMLGVSVSEMDMLRGWKDEFLGDLLMDQYTQTLSGAGSTISLMDGVHGGQVQLRAGDDTGRYARLWLGDSADGYDSIIPTSGFLMIGRWAISSTTNIVTMFGVNNSTNDRRVLARANTLVGANWYLICENAAGQTTTDSGVATDTDYHWHVLDVNSDFARWYMDGVLIAEGTANIHNAALTPVMDVQSRTGLNKYLYCDYWAVIPR